MSLQTVQVKVEPLDEELGPEQPSSGVTWSQTGPSITTCIIKQEPIDELRERAVTVQVIKKEVEEGEGVVWGEGGEGGRRDSVLGRDPLQTDVALAKDKNTATSIKQEITNDEPSEKTGTHWLEIEPTCIKKEVGEEEGGVKVGERSGGSNAPQGGNKPDLAPSTVFVANDSSPAASNLGPQLAPNTCFVIINGGSLIPVTVQPITCIQPPILLTNPQGIQPAIIKHKVSTPQILNKIPIAALPTAAKQPRLLLNSYKCDICNKMFRNHQTLKIHKRVHSSETPYQCDVCQKQFRHTYSVFIHKLRHHTEEKPYACDICNKRFAHPRILHTHRVFHTQEKQFECDVCKKRFLRFASLNIHKNTHTKEKTYACDICKKQFTAPAGLKRHKSLHGKEFVCDFCKKPFSGKRALITHMRCHNNGKEKTPHVCDFCNKEFSAAAALVKHKLLHTREETFICDICKEVFNRKLSLIVHMRDHIGRKKRVVHSCDICGKVCVRTRDLITHKRLVHAGKELYACNVCNKVCAGSSDLVAHKRVHAMDMPFECDFCSKKFARMPDLVRHKRVHAEYPCEVCSKVFRGKRTLMVHTRKQHGKKKSR